MKKDETNGQEPLGRYLGRVHRNHFALLEKKVRNLNIPISASQFMLLHALYKNDGVSQHEIAEFFKVDKAAVTRGLKKLEKASFVRRQKDKDDGRKIVVHLTEKALDFQSCHRDILGELDAIMKSVLEEYEKKELIRLLEKLEQGLARLSAEE